MANSHPHPYLMPNDGIHIYQDNIFQNPMSMIPQVRMAQAPAPAAPKNRRPLQAASSNMMLNPPSRSSRTTMSPKKLAPASGPAPLAALKPSQRNKLQPIPMAPPASHHNNTDSLQKKPFMSQFKTAAQAPTIHNTAQQPGKENARPNYLAATGTMSFAYDFLQSQPPPPKSAPKRTLMDAPNIKDSRPTKKAKTTEEPRDVEIPPYDSFPPIIDDGLKPGHSYATLIGMAILRSPNRQLTLSQIYKWISDTYSFYPSDDAGWQNSIRHNLSLHKAFYKMERPKDDPGKGNYWRIEAGMEHQFLREKPTRRFNSSNPASETVIQARPGTAKDKEKNNKTQSAQSRSQAQSRPPQARPSTAKSRRQPTPLEPTLPPSQPVPEARVNTATLPPLPTSQATISAPDLSSDATIPISDSVSPVDDEKTGMSEFVHGTQYSPLPPTMHSSPPVRRSVDFVVGTTPPPLGRNPTSSVFRSQTRAFVSMDDSGYISSLDSSVMRQKPISLLTSEADRPRTKRGRAEEEIARLRASSPHSPSKGRSWSGYVPMSSSPLRQESRSVLPLTPALKLKAPTRPPPSVSPNTSLQMHRSRISMMLQSPLRKMTGDAFDSSTFPYSPAFTLDNTVFGANTGAFIESYDWAGLHDDDNDFLNFASFAQDNSPTKRSARRSRMDRSHSTSALPNTTNSSFTSRLTSNVPTLRVWEDDTAEPVDTPSRAPQKASTEGLLQSPSPLMHTPSKQPNGMAQAQSDWTGLNEMLFDPSKFAEDESQDISGLDILQGFQKIGSGAQASG